MEDNILPSQNQKLIADTKVLIAKNKELIDRVSQLASEALLPSSVPTKAECDFWLKALKQAEVKRRKR